MMEFFIAAILGYFIGSIPFGLVLCFAAGYGDIRKIGSGNIGATNVLRTGNKFLAALTLLLDISKGFILVLLLKGFWGIEVAALAGFAAILGHNFPLWLKFKGGKGVATTIGTLLGISLPLGFGMIFVWLVTAFFTRISSASALAAFALAPLLAAFYHPNSLLIIILVYALALLGTFRHAQNIERLYAGTESKINFSKKIT